jgi:hypothetical protein
MILVIQDINAGEWSIEFQVVTDASGASEPVIVLLNGERFWTEVKAEPFTTTPYVIYFPRSGLLQATLQAPVSDVESQPVTLYFKDPGPKAVWCDKHKKPKSKCPCII